MIAENISDENLVKKILEGDNNAFQIIYEKYYLMAYKIFMNNFHNIQMAEDATHDVFIKLKEKVKTFDGLRCFKAWLIVVVRRVAYDILRMNKKNLANKSLNVFYSKNNGDCFLPNLAYQVDYLSFINKSELIEKIKEAFLKVPHSHQEILNLYYLQDLPLKAISVKMDIPLGTVKSRVARALHYFKEACKDTKGLLECL